MRVEAAELGGYAGWWLLGGAEVFVIACPYPRVLAIRRPGGRSMLHHVPGREYIGLRTWLMLPCQTPESGGAALQEARFEADGVARLETPVEPRSALGLSMEIAVDPDRPRILVHHHVRSEKARVVGLWAILALEPEGAVGFTRAARDARIAVQEGASPRDPSILWGTRTIGMDYSGAPKSQFLKLDADTDCGWVAARSGSEVIRSSVSASAGDYPLGGMRVSLFRSGPEGGRPWAEIENLGPLLRLSAGGEAAMDQEIELFEAPEGNGPDDWVSVLGW